MNVVLPFEMNDESNADSKVSKAKQSISITERHTVVSTLKQKPIKPYVKKVALSKLKQSPSKTATKLQFEETPEVNADPLSTI